MHDFPDKDLIINCWIRLENRVAFVLTLCGPQGGENAAENCRKPVARMQTQLRW